MSLVFLFLSAVEVHTLHDSEFVVVGSASPHLGDVSPRATKAKVKNGVKYLCEHECERSFVPITPPPSKKLLTQKNS